MIQVPEVRRRQRECHKFLARIIRAGDRSRGCALHDSCRSKACWQEVARGARLVVAGNSSKCVLTNPLARATALRPFILGFPPLVLQLATWGALGQLSFAPLAVFRRLRPWIWLAIVCLPIGLVFLVNFSHLTLGMLIVHMFTFDSEWNRDNRPRRGTAVKGYDRRDLSSVTQTPPGLRGLSSAG